jgi:hypothetical protein
MSRIAEGRLRITPPSPIAPALLLLLSLLAVAGPAVAGTVTCSDQVAEARASLASRLDRAGREKLDEALRLCRDNRRADALTLVRQVRDAANPLPSPTGSGPGSGH